MTNPFDRALGVLFQHRHTSFEATYETADAPGILKAVRIVERRPADDVSISDVVVTHEVRLFEVLRADWVGNVADAVISIGDEVFVVQDYGLGSDGRVLELDVRPQDDDE